MKVRFVVVYFVLVFVDICDFVFYFFDCVVDFVD